jgi:hypothetical protein
MANQTHPGSLFRLSLRELFLVVAFLAAAIVSLCYASTVWQIVLGLLVLVVFIGALVGAIVDRGRRQVFAIGMVAAMAVYQAALMHADMGRNTNTEFISGRASVGLPTTRLLRSLYTVVVHPTPEFGEGNLSGTVVGTIDRPVGSAFMSVGHCWWALLWGFASGHFARFLYLRRTSETDFAG